MSTRITCVESNRLRPDLTPVSSLTNYVGGEVLNPGLPPMTATTWADDAGREVLLDELDEQGCRHWLIPTTEQEN